MWWVKRRSIRMPSYKSQRQARGSYWRGLVWYVQYSTMLRCWYVSCMYEDHLETTYLLTHSLPHLGVIFKCIASVNSARWGICHFPWRKHKVTCCWLGTKNFRCPSILCMLICLAYIMFQGCSDRSQNIDGTYQGPSLAWRVSTLSLLLGLWSGDHTSTTRVRMFSRGNLSTCDTFNIRMPVASLRIS